MKLAWTGWRRAIREEAERDERQVCVGVDAGTRHLRVVQVQRHGPGVERALIRPLPLDERERGAALRTSLRDLLGDGEEERLVTVNMQGERVFTRHLQLPPLPPHELSVAVPIEMENSLPFPLAEAMHGFIVGDSADRHPGRRGITFVAAPRAVFGGILAMLRDFAGVQGVTMEIPSFGLARLPADAEGFTVLLDIGARFTHLGFARQGMVYYARDWSLGGEDFTRALQVGRGFTRDYAELLKTEEPVLEDPQRQNWLEPTLSRWFYEIRRSMDFFRYRLSGAPLRVDRLLLSGGGSLLAGLDARLRQQLGLEVGRLEPPALEGDEQALAELSGRAPFFSVALGLALRSVRSPAPRMP